MTNEQAQRIASLSEEMIEMAISLHESTTRLTMLEQSPTATYRQRLAARQAAAADRAVLFGIELEMLDAVRGVSHGE